MELTSLPTEILRRIAEVGPCENALALRGVSRLFNNLCSDHTLYSAIIENGNGLGPQNFPKVSSKEAWNRRLFNSDWWSGLRLRSDRQFHASARWALADSKARRWLLEGGDFKASDDQSNGPTINVVSDHGLTIPSISQSGMEERMKWFPELILAGHPVAVYICHESRAVAGAEFTNLLQTAQASQDIDQQWKACLIRACYGVPPHGRSETEGTIPYGPCRLTVGREWPQQIAISADLRRTLFFYADHETGLVPPQIHAVLALGSLQGLHAHQAENASTRFHNAALPVPPKLFDIPDQSRIEDVTPYSMPGPGSYICQAHLKTMMDPSFWEDGEWTGYYDYSYANVEIFDSEMKGIHFRAIGDIAADRFEVEGYGGRDQHGRFNITGRAYRHNGTLTLRKLYEHGAQWQWSAVMTPFGIVGSWGRDGWGGWLWLWKKEWATPRVSNS